LLIINIQ